MSFLAHDDAPLADLLSLSGRRALVTGGARGIGLAIAARLAEAGSEVVIGDRTGAPEAGARLNDQVSQRVVGIEFDVSTDGEAGVRAAADQLDGLDILVNNAGIFPPANVLEQPFEQWRRVLAVNLDGTLSCSSAAAKIMSAAGTDGRIVNVVSTQGLRGAAPGMSAYTTSKHAVVGLTKALAIDLAPYGIRVLAVAPNVVLTPGYQGVLNDLVAAGVAIQTVEHVKAGTPMGRPVTADEVARVVVFCASDMASAMTGSVIAVDTGALAV